MITSGPPFTARGLLRLAALSAVLTLAPLVLWSSLGLHASAGAAANASATSAISDWWPQAWALYGVALDRSLRLAAACVALVILVAMPCAQRCMNRPPAAAARWARLLQRPMAVPVLATAIAWLLVATPSQGLLADFVFALLAHVALTLPFVVQRIGSALMHQASGASARASASALAHAALSACLLAFALSLGESSLTALLGAPMAPPWPAALAALRSEAGTFCAATAAVTALPLLWGMGAMADALGAPGVRTSWADRS